MKIPASSIEPGMRFQELPTPVYVIDEARLRANLLILSELEKRSSRILLAQKAFSAFSFYPLIGRYISGTAASGLYEARLGFEEMGKENHVYSPAYKADEIDELCRICSHVIFNSIRQFEDFFLRLSGVSAGCASIPVIPRSRARFTTPARLSPVSASRASTSLPSCPPA